MFKGKILQLLKEAVGEARRQGLLLVEPEIVVEYPPEPKYGDYATSLPLKLAKSLGIKPLDLAQRLVHFIPPSEICGVEVAPPGYINFVLKTQCLQEGLEAILKAGESFGDSQLGGGKKALLEFVSANPTGPLHLGHGRGAVLGEALSRILSCTGYKVYREYYINDAGSQIETFSRSLYVRYLQCLGKEVEMPIEGYPGEYMVKLAEELVKEFKDSFLSLPKEEARIKLRKLGIEKMLSKIKEDLEMLGIEFNSWFRESELIERGKVRHILSLLEGCGYIEDKEGAKWFSSTALGESKDNVLIRSTGHPTYFATDIAYHYNKLVERGYDLAINIWGADHQGHVSRVKAALSALNIDSERLRVILTQMVNLKRGGQEVRLSKRAGEIITLREVMEEVGADACKFFFLSYSPDSQMDFDLELAKRQSSENPVYYVQYAYARISSVLRKAEERGYRWGEGDVSLLKEEAELMLMRKLIRLPEVIEEVALRLEPHHLARYALELATSFHDFYERCRVLSSDRQLSSARLKLLIATRLVLGKALKLMGMSAPESM